MRWSWSTRVSSLRTARSSIAYGGVSFQVPKAVLGFLTARAFGLGIGSLSGSPLVRVSSYVPVRGRPIRISCVYIPELYVAFCWSPSTVCPREMHSTRSVPGIFTTDGGARWVGLKKKQQIMNSLEWCFSTPTADECTDVCTTDRAKNKQQSPWNNFSRG